jgi:hypothetical protein
MAIAGVPKWLSILALENSLNLRLDAFQTRGPRPQVLAVVKEYCQN